MNGWFPALRLARSSSTRPRHWPVLAVLRPRSRGSHNSAPDTRLVPSCVTTIGSTTSTDHANRARTASRDSIVTQYRTRFAGMTKCRIANMQVTTFHGTRCDPRIALCSVPAYRPAHRHYACGQGFLGRPGGPDPVPAQKLPG